MKELAQIFKGLPQISVRDWNYLPGRFGPKTSLFVNKEVFQTFPVDDTLKPRFLAEQKRAS